MTLEQIKKELNLEQIPMNKGVDENGEFTGWYYYWDKANREQVAIHKDVVAVIKNNPDIDCLDLEVEEKNSPSTLEPYNIKKKIIAYDKSFCEKLKLISDIDKDFLLRKDVFPEIKVKSSLLEFIQNTKEIIENHLISQLNEPIRPVEPLEPEELGSIMEIIKETFYATVTFSLSLSFFFILFTYRRYKFSTILFIITLIFFTIFTISIYINIKEYRKNKKYLSLYPVLLNRYQHEMEEYEENLEIYNQDLHNIKNFIKSESYYSTKRFEFLKESGLLNSLKPTVDFINHRKGISEDGFLDYLQKYFSDEIITDKVIELFSSQSYNSYYEDFYSDDSIQISAYSPDFIFQHKKSELVIDIEIDEPYTFDKPIHYLNNEHDTKRNEYFLKHRWIVIRFSEEQVKNDPEGCCAEIASIIYYFTGDDSYLEKLKGVKRVYTHRKWTESESIKLMNDNFRNYENVKMEDALSIPNYYKDKSSMTLII